MKPPRPQADILIVDDEQNIRFALSEILRREGYSSEQAADGQEAVDRVRQRPYDLVLMDIRMPRLDGLAALREMKRLRPEIIVVIITAHGTNKTAVEAMELGAYDYFEKPFDLNEVRITVRRAVERVRIQRQLVELREQTKTRYSFGRIIGQSGGMQDIYTLIGRVVDNDVSVLIMGESGTGKELIASAIHHNSKRKDGPFIKVNAAAIPENLLESEMFGHERGAFTGAVAQKLGKAEAAHGGTLFLDEIGDMPLALQAKLLRMLQEREIERVGSTKPIKVDIRIICATNRDLARCVQDGTFREDLYYRINVMPIYLPPLRQRKADIPLLVDYFIETYNPRLGRTIHGLSPEALQHFLDYPWPGNIRELENMIQRVMLMAAEDVIQLADLPPTMLGAAPVPAMASTGGHPDVDASHPLAAFDFRTIFDLENSEPLADRLTRLSDHVEKHLIVEALKKTGGHRQETADLLGISRKSLHNKMVRYGLFKGDQSDFE